MKPGAVWIRVSSDGQDEKTQNYDIERFCGHHGIEVRKRYELHDKSAYKGEHEAMLRQMLDDAYRGEFQILVIWALDRIERRGIERVLRLVRLLRERNCKLASVRESWLDGSDASTELLLSVRAWMDEDESRKKSDRIRMGMAERKRKLERGERVKGRQAMGGRKQGSRNKADRPDKGTVAAAWTPERREALARTNHRKKCPVPDCQETRAHPGQATAS